MTAMRSRIWTSPSGAYALEPPGTGAFDAVGGRGVLGSELTVCCYRALLVVVVVDGSPVSAWPTVLLDAAAAVTACVVVCVVLPSRPAIGGILNGSFTSAAITSPAPTFITCEDAITAFCAGFITST